MSSLPEYISNNYEICDHQHAFTILSNSFPTEYMEVINVLSNFSLKRSAILTAGGRKSDIAESLDSPLMDRGWVEKLFDTKVLIDGNESHVPTHKIDCYKNRIALEVEWNNKDTFFDRDLNNFRLLFDLNVISVGIIITRSSELQEIFTRIGKGTSYGSSTTHFSKLKPKIIGKGSGGCPVLAFGIKPSLYVED
jgi:hypothetical protein